MATKLYKANSNISTDYMERIEMLNQLASTPMVLSLGLDDEEEIITPLPEQEGENFGIYLQKTPVDIKVDGDGTLSPTYLNQNLGRCQDKRVKEICFHIENNERYSGKQVHFRNLDTQEISSSFGYSEFPDHDIIRAVIPQNVTLKGGSYGVSLSIVQETTEAFRPAWSFNTSEIELEVLPSNLHWSEAIPTSDAKKHEYYVPSKTDIKCSLQDHDKLTLLNTNILGYEGDYGIRNLVFENGHWTSFIVNAYIKEVVWQKDGYVFTSILQMDKDFNLFTSIPTEVTTNAGDWGITVVCSDNNGDNQQWVSSTAIGRVLKPQA